MEESLKNRLILILVILSVIFFLGTIRSCGTVRKLKSALVELDKEKAVSWDAEQRVSEFKKEKMILSKELQEAKASLEATRKTLSEAELASQSLKDELEKVAKLKEQLEEDLKEALVGKSARSKR